MSVPDVPYTFRAALVRIVDGDTVTLKLDFRAHRYGDVTCRLLGVDTPEVVGATAAAGRAARAFALRWLVDAGADEWPLVAETVLDRADKYGRLLARVWRVADGHCLNDDLLVAGHAVPYEGGGR